MTQPAAEPVKTTKPDPGPRDRREDLDHCRACWTAFAKELPACPHCGETSNIERN